MKIGKLLGKAGKLLLAVAAPIARDLIIQQVNKIGRKKDKSL